MDTLIGRIGGKVILTFDFTFCNFMFGLLLENKSSNEVTDKIISLKSKLVSENIKFSDIMPLILTDNGGEFSNIFAIENNVDSVQESSLFFCDPYKSSQKPRVEKNHTLFRDIVPKGESFDDFTQQTVNLIFSHINSVKRKIYNGKTPLELFSFTYGESVAKVLGVDNIPAMNVVQSPKLLCMYGSPKI
jgi:IS30 family transposase